MVLETNHQRMEQELDEVRTEVAHLGAWVVGQGPKPPGFNLLAID